MSFSLASTSLIQCFLIFNHILFRKRSFHDDELGAADGGLGLRINQLEALHGTVGPLVELSRQEFHGEISQAVQREFGIYFIGNGFRENGFLGLLQQILFDTENVIHYNKSQLIDFQF
jgi:hypothetical protein